MQKMSAFTFKLFGLEQIFGLRLSLYDALGSAPQKDSQQGKKDGQSDCFDFDLRISGKKLGMLIDPGHKLLIWTMISRFYQYRNLQFSNSVQ